MPPAVPVPGPPRPTRPRTFEPPRHPPLAVLPQPPYGHTDWSQMRRRRIDSPPSRRRPTRDLQAVHPVPTLPGLLPSPIPPDHAVPDSFPIVGQHTKPSRRRVPQTMGLAQFRSVAVHVPALPRACPRVAPRVAPHSACPRVAPPRCPLSPRCPRVAPPALPPALPPRCPRCRPRVAAALPRALPRFGPVPALAPLIGPRVPGDASRMPGWVRTPVCRFSRSRPRGNAGSARSRVARKSGRSARARPGSRSAPVLTYPRRRTRSCRRPAEPGPCCA